MNAGYRAPKAGYVLLFVGAVMFLVAAVAGPLNVRDAIGAVVGGQEQPPAPSPAQAPAQPPPGTYRWMFGRGGDPVTWGCDPIRYRIVEAGAPPAAAAFVAEGLRRFTAASSGTFTFAPAPAIDTWQADTDDWHGVTIGWADSTQVSWAGQQVGRGGAKRLGYHLAHGIIELRRDGSIPDNSKAARGAVLQHELGHVVGLDHVGQDTLSIMTPVESTTKWSHTDRQALSYLGWYSCRNATR